MELMLIENENKTRIKVSKAQYPKYASVIGGYMLLMEWLQEQKEQEVQDG